MNPRNTNQVSEANAIRYISSNVLKPFGVIGMPKLYSKEEVENALLGIIRDVAERIDRRNEEIAKDWFNNPRIQSILNTIEKSRR
jgi:translation initiation factor 2B subunit (eIF-2B alpha/beta/delta family)